MTASPRRFTAGSQVARSCEAASELTRSPRRALRATPWRAGRRQWSPLRNTRCIKRWLGTAHLWARRGRGPRAATRKMASLWRGQASALIADRGREDGAVCARARHRRWSQSATGKDAASAARIRLRPGDAASIVRGHGIRAPRAARVGRWRHVRTSHGIRAHRSARVDRRRHARTSSSRRYRALR